MKRIVSIIILITLSNIAVAQSDSNYLPVRLSSFEVGVNNNIAELHWSTICYLQYANFEIQKSADGTNFMTIHSFTADKFRCQEPFNFNDSSISNTGKIFYRINVGSIDGNFLSSAIRTVNLKEQAFNLSSVYPTMVAAELNFTLANNTTEPIWATIINGNGATIKKEQFHAVNGIIKYTINANTLPAGFYFLQVFNGRGNLKTVKFIKK